MTGVRAEFNEDYFQSRTIQVITDGLEARRRDTYAKIQARQRLEISAYPVEAAIKDALTYHAECSLIAGLEHAALSIERAQNPGRQAAEKALVQARRFQEIMNAPASQLFPGGIAAPLGPDGLGLLSLDRLRDGASLVGLAGPQRTYAIAQNQMARLQDDFDKKVSKLAEGALKGQATGLDGLKARAKKALEYASAVLEGQLKKQAEDKEKELRDLETEVVEAVAPVRRATKAQDLVLKRIDSAKIAADIEQVRILFAVNIAGAEGDLEDKAQPDSDKVANADRKLLRVISRMSERRGDFAKRLLQSLDASNAAEKTQIDKMTAALQVASKDAIVKLIDDRGNAVRTLVERDTRDASLATALDELTKALKSVADATGKKL